LALSAVWARRTFEGLVMLSSGVCFERVRLLSLPDDPAKAAATATNALPPYFWFTLEVRISGKWGSNHSKRRPR